MKISVLIPAYNEESTILELLQLVADQRDKLDLQVIVIDDGSRDSTPELLAGRPDLYDRLITQEPNQGKGAAIRAGLAAASGHYILFQDADLEYNPADYERLVYPVREFGADVVMGSRMIAPAFTRVHYFWHKVGNRLITFAFNLLNNTTFTDVYSCYLVYRRELLDADDLRTVGWEQHAEILSKLVRQSGVYYEVPISYQGRTYSEGKKIKAHHVVAVLWTMLTERFKKPLGHRARLS